jgi:hypothetical protein
MARLRLEQNFSRPADNTAYALGDNIANSLTGASVIPLNFPLPADSGIITGASAVVTPASGSLVITALDFDLLLFLPETDIPYADAGFPADNAALVIGAASMRKLIAVFSFVNTAWRQPTGAVTAGATGFQQLAPTPRVKYPFNVSGLAKKLVGVVQAKAAWTPTGVVNRFDFALDVLTD